MPKGGAPLRPSEIVPSVEPRLPGAHFPTPERLPSFRDNPSLLFSHPRDPSLTSTVPQPFGVLPLPLILCSLLSLLPSLSPWIASRRSFPSLNPSRLPCRSPRRPSSAPLALESPPRLLCATPPRPLLCAGAGRPSRLPPHPWLPRGGARAGRGSRGSMGLLGLLSLLHSAFFRDQVGRGCLGRGEEESGFGRGWGWRAAARDGVRTAGTVVAEAGGSRVRAVSTGLGSGAVVVETVARETASGSSQGWEPLPRTTATTAMGLRKRRLAGPRIPHPRETQDPSSLRGPGDWLGQGCCCGERLRWGLSMPRLRPAQELGVGGGGGGWPCHALHLSRPQFPIWMPRVGPT